MRTYWLLFFRNINNFFWILVPRKCFLYISVHCYIIYSMIRKYLPFFTVYMHEQQNNTSINFNVNANSVKKFNVFKKCFFFLILFSIYCKDLKKLFIFLNLKISLKCYNWIWCRKYILTCFFHATEYYLILKLK